MIAILNFSGEWLPPYNFHQAMWHHRLHISDDRGVAGGGVVWQRANRHGHGREGGGDGRQWRRAAAERGRIPRRELKHMTKGCLSFEIGGMAYLELHDLVMEAMKTEGDPLFQPGYVKESPQYCNVLGGGHVIHSKDLNSFCLFRSGSLYRAPSIKALVGGLLFTPDYTLFKA